MPSLSKMMLKLSLKPLIWLMPKSKPSCSQSFQVQKQMVLRLLILAACVKSEPSVLPDCFML